MGVSGHAGRCGAMEGKTSKKRITWRSDRLQAARQPSSWRLTIMAEVPMAAA